MFYINYEECKYNLEGEMVLSYQGFILTMRNVNRTMVNSSSDIGFCFILTMRNVNINKVPGFLMRQNRFILTMRNVNVPKRLSLFGIEYSFILTMRNVNFYNIYCSSTYVNVLY